MDWYKKTFLFDKQKIKSLYIDIHNILNKPNIMNLLEKSRGNFGKESKNLIGHLKDMAVFFVNGGEIKEKYNMDFVEGGNDMVYKYVPKEEIWIDAHMDIEEIPYIIFHEYIEREIMHKYRLDYDNAHKLANLQEKHFRMYEEKFTKK